MYHLPHKPNCFRTLSIAKIRILFEDFVPLSCSRVLCSPLVYHSSDTWNSLGDTGWWTLNQTSNILFQLTCFPRCVLTGFRISWVAVTRKHVLRILHCTSASTAKLSTSLLVILTLFRAKLVIAPLHGLVFVYTPNAFFSFSCTEVWGNRQNTLKFAVITTRDT